MAKEALQEILKAATRQDAEQGIAAFVDEYGAKYPKTADSLTRDQEELLTYFDFPAEHWKSLRTTNVIESPFATVRLRQRVTKGNGSRRLDYRPCLSTRSSISCKRVRSAATSLCSCSIVLC